jgi:hypothetical protein
MGRLVVTQGAIKSLTSDDVIHSLTRHLSADWGHLDEHDWKMNDDALESGGRILSQYFTENGTKFWIITECDRSATTILLPEEY